MNCFSSFKEDNMSFCSCDPAIEDRSWSTFSFLEALMLCSMRCSQTASCVAYNFFSATNQCQLFNQTLNKFSVLPGCQYFLKKALTINADDGFNEFYINGDNIPASYFPNAAKVIRPDTYYLMDNLVVLAIKSHNGAAYGGLAASTTDGYVLTNETWKCTESYYNGWYKINYNDSSWSPAIVTKISAGSLFNVNTKWISVSTKCKNCDFYCRKNVLGNFKFLEI
ncbi:hypothetical protein HELRODRAFT_171919 [Helobdella robusta]|uniref:Apple domain-containing protein n=1 Tax=Helobdella robusta TaxID=6412 RepID=T1F4U8_HELRO|nr:hypothetical protein HELRODRAFT_171919 [Helobdella robusta]ESO04917.1 hypothetical protein HELRODRAFT_171919 [Helobdella robusta]